MDPTKVKVKERKHAEEEAKLLDSTVGRVVTLLPVAPARLENELEASVERLFDKGGSADQVDSAADGGQEVEIGIAMGVRIVAEENVVAEIPKRPRKKRQAAMDASGSSHPPKKLRGDYRSFSKAAIYGKSPSALRELLASSMLNVEVGVVTLPIITSSVSATPEHESGVPADSIIGLNIRTIGASERFVVSLDSSRHSSTHASEAEGDSIIRSAVVPPVITEVVVTSYVVNAPSIPEMGVKVTSHNVLNDSLLDDYDVSYEFVDHLDPPVLFSQIREMNYHHLFIEFNVGTTRQACLNAEVRMRTDYCLSERSRLESECEKQTDLLKVRDAEIESLKVQLLLKEAEAAEAVHLCAHVSASETPEKMHVAELQSLVSTKDLKLKELNAALSFLWFQNDGLVDQVHVLEATCSGLRERLYVYENLTYQLEEFQDAQLKSVNDKVAKLDADLAKMACHLEEKLYPHLLTTISGQ
nr:hypothetical protein [Tanacetum cinerariifolium]